MAKNILEQLGEVSVPPPPANLNDDVHQQLNSQLLMSQVWEFAICVLPVSCVLFARGLVALLMFTLTGRFDSPNMKGK